MPKHFKYTVLIVQRRLTHYRIPFFDALKRELAQRHCDLRLGYGDPTKAELDKNDGGELSWGISLQTKYYFGGRLCWQPFTAALVGADMVIITQENKLIYNLVAQFLHKHHRVGLWGHGANLQGDPSSYRERFKRLITKRADWWFGYTDLSRPLVERSGFPKSRITIIGNSVDTTKLALMRQSVKPAELKFLMQALELKGKHVGVFVGSIYSDKRIEFMLGAVAKIHDDLPSFEFLVMGSGPQQSLVEDFCRKNVWAKYLGVCKGQEKVDAMALAQVMINPGLVGLGILDSFVCGVPMVTTDWRLHSPEISYLQDGVNGLMTGNSIDQYASSVVALLKDEIAISKLKAGCEASAKKYTIENMTRNFADGVMRCLEAPVYRGRGGA